MNIRDVNPHDRLLWHGNEYVVIRVDESDETMLCKKKASSSESLWISFRDIGTKFLHMKNETDDIVNHPSHYTQHPSGVECITITEHFNFNVGNAIKYLWRAGLKSAPIEDLRKAAWYVQREIERREKGGA